MAHEHEQGRLRGAILAAARVLGVPIEVTDADTWAIHNGTVQVGLRYLDPSNEAGLSADRLAAHTLLLLWESVHETRLAPIRRSRRLAISRSNPSLEPLLATLDRVLAAAELLTAMPSLRPHIATVMLAGLPDNPPELPRHLQWLCLVLTAHASATAAEQLEKRLAADVRREWRRLGTLEGEFSQAEIIRYACLPAHGRSSLRQFERAYALLSAPYERLLELDARERGLDAAGLSAEADSQPETPEDGAGAEGSRAGGSGDDATEGGEADDAASDGAAERARAGSHKEGAEGADLFAAEQAGFVDQVLDTPLPADGDWPDGLQPPEPEASPGPVPQERRTSSGRGGDLGKAAETSLAEYRTKTKELAANIEELRDVWRRIISDRLGVRNLMSRRPLPDGEMLDREGLVRIVSEVVAGIEQPRAFLARERTVKRTKREGSTDYVLLVDRSASMQGAAAEAAAEAALIMLESLAAVSRDIAAEERATGVGLELSIRTSLIVFDSAPTVVKPLSGTLDDRVRRRMHAEIRSPRGSTNDAAALDAAAGEFGIAGRTAGSSAGSSAGRSAGSSARPTAGNLGHQRRRVLIVVSDGGSDDGGAAARRIRDLRAAGVSVFGIGIRTSELVSRFAPSGVRLNDPAALPGVLTKLIASAGDRLN